MHTLQLNFRNQQRVFEAEQKAISDAKSNAEAKVCCLSWVQRALHAKSDCDKHVQIQALERRAHGPSMRSL